VSVEKPTLPGGHVFFIEYNEKAIEDLHKKDPKGFDAARLHANSAKHIQSVWVAVKDLKLAVKSYESIGLLAGRQVHLPQFGTTGARFEPAPRFCCFLKRMTQMASLRRSLIKNKTAIYQFRRGTWLVRVSI
jgi:hypothetical protein